MRDVAFAPRDVSHALLLVEFNDAFGQIEVNRAVFVASRVEEQRQLFHVAEMIGERGISLAHFGVTFENLVHVGVGHALRRADDAGSRARRLLAASGVEVHEHAHDQAIFAGLQRAHAIGKRFGEHGDGAIGEIDGSATEARLVVERAGRVHVMRDISDVHLEMPVAVRASLDINGVIEIARGFAVDGNDRQAAKIFAACALGIADRRGALLRLLHHVG